MAAALFDDEFRARWYHALAWLCLAFLAWWEMYGWPPAVVATREALSLLFVSFGVWHALAGRAGDLVEWRRKLRVEFAVITAFYIVFIIVSQRIWPGSLGKAPFSLFNAISLMAFIFVYAWLRLSRLIRQQLAPASPQHGSGSLIGAEPRQPTPATGQDAVLLEALRKLMVEGRAYRDDALGITSLSQTLGVQEYRLRRLINGQLGHRNFSAFVNGYRLAEVEAALADPGQAEVPILTIALDAGFGSIGPFNRAFKAPYRADADGISARLRRCPVADSGIGQPFLGFGQKRPETGEPANLHHVRLIPRRCDSRESWRIRRTGDRP